VLQEPDVVVCSHASTVAAGDPRRGAIYRGETAYSPLMRVYGAFTRPRHHQGSRRPCDQEPIGARNRSAASSSSGITWL
jgi:hypothetical protein